MKKQTIAGAATLGIFVAAMLLGAPSRSAEQAAAAAPIQTVWVDGKGEKAFADKVNKVHAEMAAQGWKFAELVIYTEDNDMQGAFVTYVR